ncbi:MAG: zinc-ribbon domain-containing protein [Clostridia bacterium]|nr:zinc-ribbon domain-containing protein [Clostridia bacterium]
MFCSNCGKELNENDQFCVNCGHKVNDKMTSNVVNEEKVTTNNNLENVINDNSNTEFAKVIITRLEGSKLFNRTPMKIIYNGGIITKIVAGEVLELEFPVGQHSVVFDANGDVQDYVINIEKANSMIYIDISVISELAHSSGIPKIQSVRNADNIIAVNAKYKFNYNEILNNSSANSASSYTGMYGIASVTCVIIGLFIMGYAMSFCAITFGFLGMRRTKVLKNEKGDVLSIIGIIAGFIELALMLSQTLKF